VINMTSYIAKIEVENLTYTIPGGFNAAPYSTCLDLWELPRAQSFKGLWRWWLRALLSGALWEGGKYDMRKIQQVAGNLLGTTAQASKFIIHISIKDEARPINAQAIKEWRQRRKQLTITSNILLRELPSSPGISPIPPRLLLLLQAGESDERLAEKISNYPPGNLKITIELLKRPFTSISSGECSVAISSLLLSLIFGGVGAITRRGFGSLTFTQVKIGEEFQVYEDIVNNIVKTDDPSKVHDLLRQLIRRSLSSAQELLGVRSTMSPNEVPDHPLLSEPGDPPKDVKPFNLSIFVLSVPNVTDREEMAFQLFGFKNNEVMKLLTVIGYSTTKLFWKLVDRRISRRDRKWIIPSGFPWETWVMGLPRGQEIDKQKLKVPYLDIDLYEDSSYIRSMHSNILKTGYSLDDKGGRRTSAISIKPIKRLGKNSWIIALYGFLSKDWYDVLYHYGVTPPPKQGNKNYQVKKQELVPSKDVSRVFVEAWIRLKKIYGVK